MEISEFLLARIAEDEAVAQGLAAERRAPMWPGLGAERNPRWFVYDEAGLDVYRDQDYSEAMVRVGVTRVLAECKAKRALVEGMRLFGPIDDINAPEVLGHLASVYASHPDYRDEWKP